MEKAKFRISKHKAQCIEWYVEKVEEEICMQKWARAKYQPSIPLGDHNQRVTASPAHIALSKEAAKEGMVLLKIMEIFFHCKKGRKWRFLEKQHLTM